MSHSIHFVHSALLYYYYYYYYYYKCHGLECCHHIVAGALYKNLNLNCCTAQCRRLLTIGADSAMSAV